MFSFFIETFCKDTIIGLRQFENIRKNTIFKNKHQRLFSNSQKVKSNFVTDPIVYLL